MVRWSDPEHPHGREVAHVLKRIQERADHLILDALDNHVVERVYQNEDVHGGRGAGLLAGCSPPAEGDACLEQDAVRPSD